MARGRGGYARTPSREKSWRSILGIVLGFGANATLSGGALPFSDAATIVRCRGSLLLSMDGGTLSDQIAVTVGLGIVSQQAFTAGPGSMPPPGNEPEFPWLFWKDILLQFQTAAGDSAVERAVRVEVDTKAMRKVKPNESLVWLAQSTRLNATPSADLVIGITRVLVYE